MLKLNIGYFMFDRYRTAVHEPTGVKYDYQSFTTLSNITNIGEALISLHNIQLIFLRDLNVPYVYAQSLGKRAEDDREFSFSISPAKRIS